ncbi:MAG: fasciclin domain-containing protein, partial [Anaerolineae bacterium]|nr:fasciclin domain-containing protein [Anaerolineae bacterium]
MSRRNQEGTAYLYDLGFDRYVAVISLANDGSEADAEALATVTDSLAPISTTTILSSREDLSILAAAVEAAGLGDALNEGQFTIFAPNNQAFINLLAYLGVSADAALANTDLLTTLLTYHVVEGNFFAADVVGLDGDAVDTLLEGNQVSIDLVGETVVLNNVVEVIETDIIAGNS